MAPFWSLSESSRVLPLAKQQTFIMHYFELWGRTFGSSATRTYMWPYSLVIRTLRSCIRFFRFLHRSRRKNSWRKKQKKTKNPHFCPIGFSQSDSYQTIGSLMLLVRYLKSDRYVIPIVVTSSDIYRNIGILPEVPIDWMTTPLANLPSYNYGHLLP